MSRAQAEAEGQATACAPAAEPERARKRARLQTRAASSQPFSVVSSTNGGRRPLGPVRSGKRQATVSEHQQQLEAEERVYQRQLRAALEASRAQGRLERANRRRGCDDAAPAAVPSGRSSSTARERQLNILAFEAPGRAISYLQPATRPRRSISLNAAEGPGPLAPHAESVDLTVCSHEQDGAAGGSDDKASQDDRSGAPVSETGASRHEHEADDSGDDGAGLQVWSQSGLQAGTQHIPVNDEDEDEDDDEEDSEEFQVWSQSLRDSTSDDESDSETEVTQPRRARKRRAVPIESSSDNESEHENQPRVLRAQQRRAIRVDRCLSESDDDFANDESRDSALLLAREAAAASPTPDDGPDDDDGGTDEEDALFGLGIPPFLDQHMRPHQVDGVRFMRRCVCGLRNPGQFGCVLAHEMGLGKTLQAVALSWISLKQGFPRPGSPGQTDPCSRIIIICPTTLIMNWYNEFSKWCGNRMFVMCVSGEGRVGTKSKIARFRGDGSRRAQPDASARTAGCIPTRRARTLPAWMRDPQVLILSYESARLYAADLQGVDSSYCCDMIILDEAHRLKNELSQSRKVLAGLPCKRRVLLTGTPMQNRMEEWFSVFDFANKGVLGTSGQFMKNFVNPIHKGREPGASDKEKKVLRELSSELARLRTRYCLSMSNAILAKLLPSRLTHIVVCRPTELQMKLYDRVLQNKGALAFRNIQLLQQLCNHPKVVYDSECVGAKSSAIFTKSDFPASFTGTQIPTPRRNESNAAAGSAGHAGARQTRQQDAVNVYIQADDGRYVRVDSKGRLVVKSGAVDAAATFAMKQYRSKTFHNRVSLSNSTFQGITQFVRADTTITRTLRVGKKCSTWESFEPRYCARSCAFSLWTHHGRAWRCVKDEVKADDSTGVGAALHFKFILTSCTDATATVPAGATAGASSAAGLPITAQAMTSFINGSSAREVDNPAATGSDQLLSKCLLEYSAKMVLIDRMLKVLSAETSERIVIVAQHKKTLDILQDLCEERGYKWRRVDGSTAAHHRQLRVNELNNRSNDVFVFLLSAKAGAMGLNLIGANRLVIFDPDWNPAIDDQAAARIWRDGQRRQVFIYRLVCTGTIEEKILQRQISKHGLQGTVTYNPESNKFSESDLRDLFRLRRDTASETHEKVCNSDTCKEMQAAADGHDADEAPADNDDDTGSDDVEEQDDEDGPVPEQAQVGEPETVELSDWSHHHDVATTSDALLQTCGGGGVVSFVFACLRKGCEPAVRSFGEPAAPQVSDDDDDDDQQSSDTENDLVDRRKGRCHHCGRDGHWKFECPKLVPRLHQQLEAFQPFRRVSVVFLVGTLSLSPTGNLNTVGQNVSSQYGARTRLLRELIRMGGGHIYAKLQPMGSAHETTHVIVGRTTTAAAVFAAARQELGATKAQLTRPGLVVVTTDWISNSVRIGCVAAARPWLAAPDRKSPLRPIPPKVEDTCRDVLVAIVNRIEAAAYLRAKPSTYAVAPRRGRGRGRGWWRRGRGRGRGNGRSRSWTARAPGGPSGRRDVAEVGNTSNTAAT